jgi:hypothetical protein
MPVVFAGFVASGAVSGDVGFTLLKAFPDRKQIEAELGDNETFGGAEAAHASMGCCPIN